MFYLLYFLVYSASLLVEHKALTELSAREQQSEFNQVLLNITNSYNHSSGMFFSSK